jgi:hypothetical protein
MLAVLSLGEEYRLRMKRKMSVPTKQEVREGCIMRSFVISTVHLLLFRRSNNKG